MKRLKNNRIILILAIALTFVFTLFLGTSQVKADANLKDGTYTAPFTVLKTGSTTASMANQFFKPTATVNVSNGKYSITVTTTGAQYIKGVTVNGQPVVESNQYEGTQEDLTYTQNSGADISQVAFQLHVPVIGAMNQTAQFQVQLENATLIKAAPSATTTATPSNPAATTTSSSTTPNNAVMPTTTTTKVVKTVTTVTKTTTTTNQDPSKRYVVLQSSGSSKSVANKFYTHIAQISKAKGSKDYKVTFNVKYKKALKIGSKAVKPVSVMGKKVPSSRIKYGQTSKDYTMSYYFYVKKLSSLNKVFKAQIHVDVPHVENATYTIRFDFK